MSGYHGSDDDSAGTWTSAQWDAFLAAKEEEKKLPPSPTFPPEEEDSDSKGEKDNCYPDAPNEYPESEPEEEDEEDDEEDEEEEDISRNTGLSRFTGGPGDPVDGGWEDVDIMTPGWGHGLPPVGGAGRGGSGGTGSWDRGNSHGGSSSWGRGNGHGGSGGWGSHGGAGGNDTQSFTGSN